MELIAIVSIGIGINAFVNVVYLFILTGVNKRLERLENIFINKNISEKE